MPPAVDKAFDFAQEVTRQLITLATGIIALTITFLVDVLANDRDGVWALKVAWVCYLLSVPLGVAAMLSMSGNLERPRSANPSIYTANIVFFSAAQIVTFLAGLVFTLVFGFLAL